MMITIEKQIDLGRYQNGERKKRSPKDNWLAILAVIERNQSLKRDTIVLFADAIKCFDKLWLVDFVSEMLKDGLREREALMVFEINKRARIEIASPFGETEELKKREL